MPLFFSLEKSQHLNLYFHESLISISFWFLMFVHKGEIPSNSPRWLGRHWHRMLILKCWWRCSLRTDFFWLIRSMQGGRPRTLLFLELWLTPVVTIVFRPTLIGKLMTWLMVSFCWVRSIIGGAGVSGVGFCPGIRDTVCLLMFVVFFLFPFFLGLFFSCMDLFFGLQWEHSDVYIVVCIIHHHFENMCLKTSWPSQRFFKGGIV